jgi:hypothetical protein
MSHSHTFTYRYPTYLPHSQHLRVMVSLLLKATWVTPGDQAPLLPLRGRPNIWTQVLTSLMGGAPLAGSCTSPGSVLCWRPSPQLVRRTSPSSGSNHLLIPDGITSPSSPGDALQWQGRCKNTLSKSWMILQKCCRILEYRDGTPRQISRKHILLCQHRLSGLVSKGWDLRTMGFYIIYPCKQITEATSKV